MYEPFPNYAISDLALDLGEWALDQEYEQRGLRFDLPPLSQTDFPRTRTNVPRKIPFHRTCLHAFRRDVQAGKIPKFTFIDGVCIRVYFEEAKV